MGVYIGTCDFSGATVTGIAGVTPTFDAVVAASGGDYTTLGAAITAGKKAIYIKNGTYTETGAITLPANCLLIGESHTGATVNMGSYGLTTAAGTTIYNLKLSFNRDGNLITIGGDFNIIESCFIESLRSSNPTAQIGVITDNNVAQTRCYLSNVWFDIIPTAVNMANLTGIWIQNAASDNWRISNISLGGSATQPSKHIFCAASECSISNVIIWNVGTAGVTSVQLSGNYNQITNLSMKGSTSRIEISGSFNSLAGFNSDNASNTVYISGDGNVVTNATSLGNLSNVAGGDHNMISTSRFDAGMTIAGNNNNVVGSSIGALAGAGSNTITISSGATDNIIIGCRTDAAISDGGTGSVLTSNVVY
jgi:hypothetical protein